MCMKLPAELYIQMTMDGHVDMHVMTIAPSPHFLLGNIYTVKPALMITSIK